VKPYTAVCPLQKTNNSSLLESDVIGLQIATEDNAIRVALSSPCIIPYSAIADT